MMDSGFCLLTVPCDGRSFSRGKSVSFDHPGRSEVIQRSCAVCCVCEGLPAGSANVESCAEVFCEALRSLNLGRASVWSENAEPMFSKNVHNSECQWSLGANDR